MFGMKFSKIVMFFLFSGWMFVLGIIVGRETVPLKLEPDNLQEELVELKEAGMKEDVNRFATNSDSFYNKDFEFYDELKNNRKQDVVVSLDSKKPPEKSPLWTKKESGIIEKIPHPESGKKKTVRNTVRNTVKNTVRPKPENAKMSIQVASFKDRKAADTNVDTLRKKGFEAFRSAKEIEGKGVWHRVMIGYFKRRAEAGPTLKKIKKKHPGAFMVNIGKQ